MQLKRIVVGLLASPTQKGDAAIGLGALRLARARWPEARIMGVAGHLVKDCDELLAAFETAYEVPVLPSPIAWQRREAAGAESVSGHPGRSKLLRELPQYAVRQWGLDVSALLGCRGIGALPSNLRGLAEAIAGSDLVILRGGGFISAPNLATDVLGLRLFELYLPLLARALGVPYALWGHTIWALDGPLTKRILWPVIRDSTITVCREEVTRDYLLREGAPAGKLALLPDTAFALEPENATSVQEILVSEGLDDGTPMVGVAVIRPRLHPETSHNRAIAEPYLLSVAHAIDHLCREHGVRVVLVRHNFSEYPSLLPESINDVAVYPELLDLVKCKDGVSVIEGNYSPEELAGLYGCFEMMITTRLHVGILASLAYTPSLAIAYNPFKTRGIMETAGTGEWVMGIDAVTPSGLADMADRLWVERGHARSRVAGCVAALKDRLVDYGRLTELGLPPSV